MINTPENDLFSPVVVGPYILKNRIIMAPLTRARSAESIATSMMQEYYTQRSSAGLIISEGLNISPQAVGYAFTPGLWTAEQIESWRPVTAAVHDKGGRIFAQLWHVGRVSHPDVQLGGELPVAPSAVRPDVEAFTAGGKKPALIPRALGIDELPGIVADFEQAAHNALVAGFDGVEIHAANGYLLDQFMRDGANRRTDAYGGVVENRIRLTLEVTKAVAAICNGGRTGLRISPISTANGLSDSNPEPVFKALVDQLNDIDLAYLHVVEGITRGPRIVKGGFDLDILRQRFKGIYMANNGYDRDLAFAARHNDTADLIAFGRHYIANPDLVTRLELNLSLNPLDNATAYGGGAAGYTDYPFLPANDPW
ncbi:alkene reductase [Shewanella algicola]|jgi:N-ethylmaleimide reductase|uniref:Alkene reductase n=1 Tax=Shewanella algicola TaxID=640633 RepID=A0A9X2CFM2_9GAMM|nr:alkene reductase [Shewanella algicola]MCL1107546.1 alkene reductase [Shewanella algicola]GGP70318.1 alkene reductase [Shewanella algicola]|tara:strand:+ start:11537 stop:12640 length:1104 start_codon:yes stop_codon:yes gene_type:complete